MPRTRRRRGEGGTSAITPGKKKNSPSTMPPQEYRITSEAIDLITVYLNSEAEDRELQEKAAASTVSTPSASTKKKVQLSAESPTIIGTSSTVNHLSTKSKGDLEDTDNACIVLTSSSSQAIGSQDDAPDSQEGISPEEVELLPLIERIPSVGAILSFLRAHHRFEEILSTPNVFSNKEERDAFAKSYLNHIPTDGDFWMDAWDYMYIAIEDNMPTCQSELKRCRDEYHHDTMHLINTHFYCRDLPEYQEATIQRKQQLRNLSGRIGFVFLDVFELLISPPKGSKITTINKQLDECLGNIQSKDLAEYFTDDIDKIVYYIAGFLFRAFLRWIQS
jgi:hypothetical protein